MNAAVKQTCIPIYTSDKNGAQGKPENALQSKGTRASEDDNCSQWFLEADTT